LQFSFPIQNPPRKNDKAKQAAQSHHRALFLLTPSSQIQDELYATLFCSTPAATACTAQPGGPGSLYFVSIMKYYQWQRFVESMFSPFSLEIR